MKPGHQGGQSDAACPLDVVVETGYLRAIFVEDAFCILQAKVLAVGNLLVIPS